MGHGKSERPTGEFGALKRAIAQGRTALQILILSERGPEIRDSNVRYSLQARRCAGGWIIRCREERRNP